jgi:ribosomal protein S18 acetylase RimI-like enzyme
MNPMPMPTRNAIQNEAEFPIADQSAQMLDNPIWSALTTDQAHLAVGGDLARRFPDEIGPLSGMPSQSDAGYEALRPLAGPGGIVGLFFREAPRLPAGWTLVRGGTLHQMVAARPHGMTIATPGRAELRKLTTDDAPAMVELATLTEPGPFRLRTMELGTFYGIVEGGRLMAMAGKRMHLPGYVEVSGVCTHPDARGRGYARLLMSRVMEEIVRDGRTPFLHSFADNYGAIRVYESLGFKLRQRLELAVVKNRE